MGELPEGETTMTTRGKAWARSVVALAHASAELAGAAAAYADASGWASTASHAPRDGEYPADCDDHAADGACARAARRLMLACVAAEKADELAGVARRGELYGEGGEPREEDHGQAQ